MKRNQCVSCLSSFSDPLYVDTPSVQFRTSFTHRNQYYERIDTLLHSLNLPYVDFVCCSLHQIKKKKKKDNKNDDVNVKKVTTTTKRRKISCRNELMHIEGREFNPIE